jgi:hypothetical protein
MEPESLLPPASGPYPEPDASSSRFPTLFI